MINQISVFVENRTGRLADVLLSLKNANINIYALHVADTTDYGIIRLIVDFPEKAQTVLIKHGHTVAITSVLGVAMEDKVGSLYDIVEALRDAGVAVEYIYAFAGRSGINPAVVIVKPKDIQEAEEMLKNKNFKLISIEEV